MNVFNTYKIQRKVKVVLKALLLIFFLGLLWAIIDNRIFNYKDFVPYNNCKPKIFHDSIRNNIRVQTSMCNFDDDTLFYFKIKEKYWVLYWSSGHFQNLSVPDIIEMKEKNPIVEHFKTYCIYSLGGDCPFHFKAKVRLPEIKKFILALNGRSTVRSKVISEKFILYNLKCSVISIVSLDGYLDLMIEISGQRYFSNLLIYKSPNRFYILYMESLKDEDVNLTDLFEIVNINAKGLDFQQNSEANKPAASNAGNFRK